MRTKTRELWHKQNQHPGDRWRLFRAVSNVIRPETALYAGSYVDVAPSFVFSNVTYVDMDRRAAQFFDDIEGVQEIVAEHSGHPGKPAVRFIHSDYSKLDLQSETFDLLISLYAGFISEYCTDFLKIGGHLLVNPSHGDAALASIDQRYQLAGVVLSRPEDYRVSEENLSDYMIPKKPTDITRDLLFSTQRGIAYTRPAFAYIFKRVV